MSSIYTGPSQRKRTPYKKSRYGCRNCKLRRIRVCCNTSNRTRGSNLQCDEAKPQCLKCRRYGVLCNFVAGVSELQTLGVPYQSRGHENANQLPFVSSLPRPLNLPFICSDDDSSFEMDTSCVARLERFRMCAINTFSAEMMKIWKYKIPHIAFRNPYLMHTMLALAVTHERHQNIPNSYHQTKIEAHHATQCALLFNQKLSRTINTSDRDPLWATAALLGMLAIASFDIKTTEEAWPLRESNPSDLEWFRLSEGKRVIWDLTNPLRPGGVFQAMAHEYGQFDMKIPPFGVEDIPPSLAEVCNIKPSSNAENNPYFVAAHILVQLQRLSGTDSASICMVSFVSQSQPSFRDLLLRKDPAALLLLAQWYEWTRKVWWWIERRAEVEIQAIRLYLARFHGDGNGYDSRIHHLLPSLGNETESWIPN